MYEHKMIVDEMIVNKMTVGKMTVVRMTAEIMTKNNEYKYRRKRSLLSNAPSYSARACIITLFATVIKFLR
jgi:hypothetical protein